MALQTGRNSVGIDIDPEYCRFALRRLDSESGPLLTRAGIGGSEGHFPIFLSDVKARRRILSDEF